MSVKKLTPAFINSSIPFPASTEEYFVSSPISSQLIQKSLLISCQVATRTQPLCCQSVVQEFIDSPQLILNPDLLHTVIPPTPYRLHTRFW
ncbi:hypothetical protein CW304_16885 [Bacillus sp. UFRGS-B20]|nr:hypothetical protein CW304_16885 [Bacillus sp. UFRGS-B20]